MVEAKEETRSLRLDLRPLSGTDEHGMPSWVGTEGMGRKAQLEHSHRAPCLHTLTTGVCPALGFLSSPSAHLANPAETLRVSQLDFGDIVSLLSRWL